MPLKGLSFEEIVKKEMDEGKPQDQAVAIAYEVTGKDKKNMGNHLTGRERFDSLNARTARGSERYASVIKNSDFNINDLDPYERHTYDDMSIRMGHPKELCLKLLINQVEGDWTQLSPALQRYARSKGLKDGDMM